MDLTDTWVNFLKEKLLTRNIVDGILLFTSNLLPVHMCGCLQDTPLKQLSQFHKFF